MIRPGDPFARMRVALRAQLVACGERLFTKHVHELRDMSGRLKREIRIIEDQAAALAARRDRLYRALDKTEAKLRATAVARVRLDADRQEVDADCLQLQDEQIIP
jgi:septal ring factor EnvC (AmiA/AmiB activator)